MAYNETKLNQGIIMLKPIAYATLYAKLAKYHATQAAINVKDAAVDHKSELTCIAGTAAVVGLAARVNGFQAGYEFAKSSAA
jgi:hypothetical protein